MKHVIVLLALAVSVLNEQRVPPEHARLVACSTSSASFTLSQPLIALVSVPGELGRWTT